MPSVVRIDVPRQTLLDAERRRGCHADCFATRVPVRVSLAAFVRAFLTTPPFRAERWILGWALGQPTSDEDAAALAEGRREVFAVWRVAARTADEILLSAGDGQTSTWLTVEPPTGDTTGGTRLLFGSAIERRAVGRDGAPRLSRGFRAVLGFHDVYSRVLLRAAASRLVAGAKGRGPGRWDR